MLVIDLPHIFHPDRTIGAYKGRQLNKNKRMKSILDWFKKFH